MNPTLYDMKKISTYLGLTRDVIKSLYEWMAVGPIEPFSVDEFIDWVNTKNYLNL